MKNLSEYLSNNCLKRALRTFLQTSFGYMVTNITMFLSGIDFCNNDVIKNAFIGLAIASASAGLSAVMNFKKESNDYNG